MASTYCGTNNNNVATGLIGIRTTNNQNALTPIGNTGYRFNGSVANVFELTADTNTVTVVLNVETAITLQWGRLTVVRIA